MTLTEYRLKEWLVRTIILAVIALFSFTACQGLKTGDTEGSIYAPQTSPETVQEVVEVEVRDAEESLIAVLRRACLTKGEFFIKWEGVQERYECHGAQIESLIRR